MSLNRPFSWGAEMLVSKSWVWRMIVESDLSWSEGSEIDDLIWTGLDGSQVSAAGGDERDYRVMRAVERRLPDSAPMPGGRYPRGPWDAECRAHGWVDAALIMSSSAKPIVKGVL